MGAGMEALRRGAVAGLGAAALAATPGTIFWGGGEARAAYTFTFREEGGASVVGEGSGSFNLTGLTRDKDFFGSSYIWPSFAVVSAVGTTGSGNYYFGLTGPTNFGPGADTPAISGPAPVPLVIGVEAGRPFLGLGYGYTSGSVVSHSLVIPNATFASLGMTPGTYVWTWGTGADADSFTLQIGPTAPPPPGVVPSPGAALVFGAGLLGLGAALRRRRAAR